MTISNGHQKLKQCLNCNALFTPVRNWQKNCSNVCSYTRRNNLRKRDITNHGSCARCGKSLEHKKSHAIYCSKTCVSMDHSFKHRAKTRTQGTARRKAIYERDEGQCYLCKQPVSFKNFELDHLLPVSRNGDSSPQNLAVSCMSCNRRRGTKLGIEQLIKLSELRTLI